MLNINAKYDYHALCFRLIIYLKRTIERKVIGWKQNHKLKVAFILFGLSREIRGEYILQTTWHSEKLSVSDCKIKAQCSFVSFRDARNGALLNSYRRYRFIYSKKSCDSPIFTRESAWQNRGRFGKTRYTHKARIGGAGRRDATRWKVGRRSQHV